MMTNDERVRTQAIFSRMVARQLRAAIHDRDWTRVGRMQDELLRNAVHLDGAERSILGHAVGGAPVASVIDLKDYR